MLKDIVKNNVITIEDILAVANSLGGFDNLSETGNGFCCFGGSWYNSETEFWYDLTVTFDGEVYEKFSYGDGEEISNDYVGLTQEDVIKLVDMLDSGSSKHLTIYNGAIHEHLISSDVTNDKGECIPYINVGGKIILV